MRMDSRIGQGFFHRSGLAEAEHACVAVGQAGADGEDPHAAAGGVGQMAKANGFVVPEAVSAAADDPLDVGERIRLAQQGDEVVLADPIIAIRNQHDSPAVTNGGFAILDALVRLQENAACIAQSTWSF